MKLALAALMAATFAAQDEKIIKFEAPKEWTKETPNSTMRKAQYKVPDKEKKAKDGEFTLYTFGKGAGGVEANLKRWSAQMGGAEAKPEAIEGKVKVTLVDLKGTYTPGFGGAPIENARMLGAIAETADGLWFFKVVGPADTVGDWRDEVVKMLKEVQP
ncbi:MAG TPA: hypothetical protein VJB14_16695 [Planctomycetota bacterium]|nr:hypothetical protein [Planctomycetota bacterium]